MARIKQKLKEKAESSAQPAQREGFTKLFATAQNLPANQEQSHARLSKLTTPSELKQTNRTFPNTELTTSRDMTKSLMATVPNPPPPETTVLRKKRKAQASAMSNGWFLLIPAIGLTTFVLLGPDETLPSRKTGEQQTAEYERPEFRESVDFHRKTTGWKLNRERIGIDLDNRVTAPAITANGKSLPKPDIMMGLPLQGEKNHMRQDDIIRQPSESYPDVNIANQIRKEQEAIAFDQAARNEFIRELEENAARAGYDVQIDQDGNALFKKLKRQPSSRGNESFNDSED